MIPYIQKHVVSRKLIYQVSKISNFHRFYCCEDILPQSIFKLNTLPDFVWISPINGGNFTQLFKLRYIVRHTPTSLPELHEFQLLSVPDRSKEVLLVEWLFKHLLGNISLGIFQQPLYAIPPKFDVRFQHIGSKSYHLVVNIGQNWKDLLHCLDPFFSLVWIEGSPKARRIRFPKLYELEVFQVDFRPIWISSLTSFRLSS